jgi:RimJ/RimL family protein N-acetyltransferase
MRDELEIRGAEEMDARGLAALSASVALEGLAWFKNEGVPESSFRELLVELPNVPNSVVLVAGYRGQIVGELECFGLSPHYSEFVISVHRQYRRAGVASALLRALIEWAESQQDLERLQAKVLEPNVASRCLLERFGFSVLLRHPHTATIQGVEMPEHLYFRDFER